MCYYQYRTLALIPKFPFKFQITAVALNSHFRPQSMARAQPLGGRGVRTPSKFLLTPQFWTELLTRESV